MCYKYKIRTHPTSKRRNCFLNNFTYNKLSKENKRKNEEEAISLKNKKIYVPVRTEAVKITGRTHNLNLIMERMS